MSELFAAHKQWFSRPDDERYRTLAEMHSVAEARHQASVASRVHINTLEWVAGQGERDLFLAGSKSMAVPSNWAFSQACTYLDAPAAFLRRQPAPLVAENLNWASHNAERQELVMLWANGPEGCVRCFSTPLYGRLWDSDVIAWLRQLTADETNGWHRPHAMDEDKRPSGYYLGDRNLFAFMVNDDVRIEDGSKEGLARGFFIWNSEVNQMSFGMRAFLYRYVCGNHIVWGAEDIFNLRMIHLGQGMSRHASREFQRVVNGYLTSSTEAEAAVIEGARKKAVAKTPEDAIDFLASKRVGFTQKDALEITVRAQVAGEDPTNLWALVNAATSMSQNKFTHADERNAFDKKASAMLRMVDF